MAEEAVVSGGWLNRRWCRVVGPRSRVKGGDFNGVVVVVVVVTMWWLSK